MLATIVHRGLSVWVNPVERTARIQVHMPGRPEDHVVNVRRSPDGWLLADAREDEPVWFSRFEQALGEAVACAAEALEDRLLAELARGATAALADEAAGLPPAPTARRQSGSAPHASATTPSTPTPCEPSPA